MSFLSHCSVLLNNNSTIFTMTKGLSQGEITNRYMFGIPFLHKVYGNNVLCMESTAIWQNLYTVISKFVPLQTLQTRCGLGSIPNKFVCRKTCTPIYKTWLLFVSNISYNYTELKRNRQHSKRCHMASSLMNHSDESQHMIIIIISLVSPLVMISANISLDGQ